MRPTLSIERGTGDFAIMPRGHDAWVVGEEPCVFIDAGLRRRQAVTVTAR